MVELFINDKKIDTVVEEPLALTYAFDDIEDIEQNSNSTTKSIPLPATAQVKQFFGFPDEPTVSDFKGQKTDLKSVVKEQGIDVFSGIVNLLSTQRNAADGSQPDKYNIAIIGNNKIWVEAIGQKTLKDITITEQHQLTYSNILNSVNELNSYVYGPQNLGVFTQEKIIRCEARSSGTYTGCLTITLETRNYLHGYKYKFFTGDFIVLWGFNTCKRYNGPHEILEMLTNADGADQLVLSTSFSQDDTGYARQNKEKLYCEDISFHWNIAKVFKKILSDAGYQVSSSFIDSYFFKNKYCLAPTFKRSNDWIDLNSGIIGLSAVNANSNRSIEPAWDLLISGNSTHFDLTNHVLKANDFLHLKLKISIFYDVNYGSVPGEVKCYFLYKVGGLGSWYQHDDWIGKVIQKNTYTELVNVSQKLEQEVDIRMEPGDLMMINVRYSDLTGPDSITIYNDGTKIEIIAQETIVNNATVIVNDVLPDWKQIDFIKAVRNLFNLKFITDDFKKVIYIEPRDSFYTTNTVDWMDKLDLSSEIKIEELGGSLGKTNRLSYIIDSNDDYDKTYKDKNGFGWASGVRAILNRFADDSEKEITNGIFSATQMEFAPHLGFVHSRIPRIWKSLQDDQTVPEKFTDFAPRILSLYPTKYCQSGDTWIFGGYSQSQFPYFYFYDGSIDDNLCFNDIPGIGLGMKGLLNKRYGNYFRTIDNSRKITAYLDLKANDLQGFTTLDSRGLDFRARYILRINNEAVYCRLDSIVEYRPGENIPTKCVLITDSDLPDVINESQIFSVVFYNNVNSIANGDAHANGSIMAFSPDWYLLREGTSGNVISGDNDVRYGICSRGQLINRDIRYFIERGFIYFDTSTLPDNCTILEAMLHIRKEGGASEMEIAVFEGTQSNQLILSDFDNFNSVLFGESAPGPLGSRYITLNQAGKNSISKTGWTKFALREKHFDLANNIPTNNFLSFKTFFSGAAIGHEIYLSVKYKL